MSSFKRETFLGRGGAGPALLRADWVVLVAALLVACNASERPIPHACVGTAVCDAADPQADDGGVALAPDSSAAASDCPTSAPGAVTLASVLHELVDFDALTHDPAAAHTSSLASSFDRASLNAQPGEPDWFANHDWVALTGSTPVVLLDADGPGLVSRIWSANPSGTLRVFIDNAATPALEADMKALLRGDVEPFTAPYAFAAGGGYDFYFPIPFRKHCRITVTSDADQLYFQINHRTYQTGTDVQSFSQAALAGAACARKRAEQQLLDPAPSAVPSAQHATFTLSTADGDPVDHQLTAAEGGVLTELRVHVLAESSPDALRETVLAIEVDGEETVRVPLGDFFGSGPGWHEVHNLASDVDATQRLLVARWPMPFRHTLKLALIPTSSATLRAELQLTSAARELMPDTRLFYARWHGPESQSSQPVHDWNLATISGRGAYVGTVLEVVNDSASWWGEGDEKIYVDREKFPSDFGTGTEDYFGYGWCSNQLFSTPFVGQTLAGSYRNYGAVSLYRLQLLDAIEFSSDLRFDLEVDHWGSTPVGVSYAAVVYFYARPGATLTPLPIAPAAFRVSVPSTPVPAGTSAGAYQCGSG